MTQLVYLDYLDVRLLHIIIITHDHSSRSFISRLDDNFTIRSRRQRKVNLSLVDKLSRILVFVVFNYCLNICIKGRFPIFTRLFSEKMSFFSKKHYIKINGTAMGTRMAPSYANLLWHHWKFHS